MLIGPHAATSKVDRNSWRQRAWQMVKALSAAAAVLLTNLKQSVNELGH
jgi:hypothetical protein